MNTSTPPTKTRKVKSSTPAPVCRICGISFQTLTRHRKVCLRCKFMELKPTNPEPVMPKSPLEELGVDWIGRYYSCLDFYKPVTYVFERYQKGWSII